MARILVVEQDKETRELLSAELRTAGHAVRSVATGSEGLRLARERCPDVVLLDASPTDLEAIDVARPLRLDARTADARIIALAKNHVVAERIIGVENGADECLVTPFTVRELLVRIRAVHEAARRPGQGPICVGTLRIDRDAESVSVDGEELVLTALELKLLVTLCDRRDKVQSRDVLLADVWGIQASVETRTVDTHVKRLREKLGSMRASIQSVRGVGYRFVAPKDQE